MSEAIARKFFSVLGKDANRPALAMMAPGFTWWISGHNAPDADFEQIGAAMDVHLAKPIDFIVVDLQCVGDVVYAEVEETASLKNGTSYVIGMAFRLEIKDGLITSVREYTDTKGFQEIWAPLLSGADSSPAEQAIRANREATNELMRTHDAEGFRAYMLPDITLVGGNGHVLAGADACVAAFTEAYAEEGFVTYHRSTTSIALSDDGTFANEYGTWRGEWTAPLNRLWTGEYSAMWRLNDGKWKLQAELYVLLHEEKLA